MLKLYLQVYRIFDFIVWVPLKGYGIQCTWHCLWIQITMGTLSGKSHSKKLKSSPMNNWSSGKFFLVCYNFSFHFSRNLDSFLLQQIVCRVNNLFNGWFMVSNLLPNRLQKFMLCKYPET